jgi:hypothetical protein
LLLSYFKKASNKSMSSCFYTPVLIIEIKNKRESIREIQSKSTLGIVQKMETNGILKYANS